MLDLIILVRTCQVIHKLCKERNLSSVGYIILNILGYILLFYGIFFGSIFISDQLNSGIIIFVGLILGIGAYVLCNYLIRKKIKSYPTTANDEIDLIGKIGN